MMRHIKSLPWTNSVNLQMSGMLRLRPSACLALPYVIYCHPRTNLHPLSQMLAEIGTERRKKKSIRSVKHKVIDRVPSEVAPLQVARATKTLNGTQEPQTFPLGAAMNGRDFTN
mmetsp:Transcript_4609/g.9925  ORF Transcript_4609/g.9925 Transcript_4609/m.9925 type:complete len:114 (+) Transcript_4609:186-527(+)